MTTTVKTSIKEFIAQRLPEYQELALDIHDHPEVSNYEFYSADALIAQLEKRRIHRGKRSGWSSYRVRCPLSKRQTWTNISFLAEYDALPGIGHACGHNLFGTYSVLAASVLQPYVDELGGEIRVYGTPGEEGAKMAQQRAVLCVKDF